MTLLARFSEPRGRGSCVGIHAEKLKAQCVSILCTIPRLLEAAVAAKKSGLAGAGKDLWQLATERRGWVLVRRNEACARRRSGAHRWQRPNWRRCLRLRAFVSLGVD
jgi:hypothetical protein